MKFAINCIVVVMLMFVIGCGESNIEKVQNWKPNQNTTLTLNDVLNRHPQLYRQEWTEFQSVDGKTIVQFYATLDSTCINNYVSYISDNWKTAESEEEKQAWEYEFMFYYKTINAYNIRLGIQFIINTKEETETLSYTEISYWRNDIKESVSIPLGKGIITSLYKKKDFEINFCENIALEAVMIAKEAQAAYKEYFDTMNTFGK